MGVCGGQSQGHFLKDHVWSWRRLWYQRLREEGFREGMSQVPRQAETCWTQHRGGQAWLKREFQRDGRGDAAEGGKESSAGSRGGGRGSSPRLQRGSPVNLPRTPGPTPAPGSLWACALC